MSQKIRWKERFNNFKKALTQLEKALQKSSYNDLEQAGLIQTYEFTFELGWKTLKDYLEQEGKKTLTPAETIRQAYQYELIDDARIWLDALKQRNLMSRTYNEEASHKAVSLITNSYFEMLKKLHTFLEKQL